MEEGLERPVPEETEDITRRQSEVVYRTEKDFYKGMSGELRYKAEGLFKKAKEKGISIEDIQLDKLRENSAAFPGIGAVDLPAYLVRVKGRDIQSGQQIADGKQIDYYNRYQVYLAEKIAGKNYIRDDRGRVVRENGKPRMKDEQEMQLTEWEQFEIGKSLVEDKEFGLEKTITGACDRIIRKLMGENDWLDPAEARLLDEEFDTVQERISEERESRKQFDVPAAKKATERQINYLKARIKNAGLDPESENVAKEIIRLSGIKAGSFQDMSSSHMSRVIDSFPELAPRIREALSPEKGNIQH